MAALLGPFSSVNLLVLPKVRPVAKDFPTFATLGAFHQREPSGADLECNFGRKLFHTPCTRKAFPQSEFSDAFSTEKCVAEGLPTLLTHIGCFSSVNFLVTNKH